ncbi:MAG TPA: UDP-N-acetylmuramoyl-L-alanine--D-glutamate ligase [Solirubrobacteraceae bacterium]|nr:UDP-N-acetylmuramoyl-L-alanine--D-glutamate ligase [Solirubrobacteraceae bacterium]
MRPRPDLPGGPYLVVGLARSGVGAALALRDRGEEVIGVDAGSPEGLRELTEAGVEIHLREEGTALVARAGTVIKSPGVPREAPVIAGALARGIEVLGELEMAWRLLENEVIAVTGTNGKTTTVEWVGHIHRTAGLPVTVAGNVGTALSGLAGKTAQDVTVVCEASSFQLQDTDAFAAEAAVLLNIAPDHLDRHGTFEEYVQAKLEIFARQGNEDIAVAPLGLGVEDLGGCGRRVCFGSGPGAALSERAGELWWEEQPLMSVGEIGLRGAHNVQNAMAAAAVCLARGLSTGAVREGLRSFAGVKHRLEVARSDGVLWVNDSKATNVASTLVALDAFPAGTVHLILGGRGKGQDFSALRAPVERRCEAVYLIGEDAPLIAAALASVSIPVHECGELELAIARAREAARDGDVVLLSPACASFDQFADFEARGERFRELVQG